MAAHSHARDLLAHPYRAMEPRAVGLAKSDFGCSTLLLGAPPPQMWLGFFLCVFSFPCAFGFHPGRRASRGVDPNRCLFGGFWGGCGSPIPGLFVPQPLEATEALSSLLIYSRGTFRRRH